MDEATEIEKDLMVLTELLQEIAEKHGGIYISMSHCENSDYSSASYEHEKNKYRSVFSNGGTI